MAPHAPPPKASSHPEHHLRPVATAALAAEPSAKGATRPVGASARVQQVVAVMRPQAEIAAPVTVGLSAGPGAAWPPQPSCSLGAEAAEEDTLVDAELAERIAAELAREQDLALPTKLPVTPQALAPRLGPYRLLRLLASGQTSVVHLARSEEPTSRARHLAIRSLRREHARDAQRALAFVENARLFCALRHGHFAQVLDAGIDGGTPYVVMDYLPGQSLRTALQQRPGGLPLDFAVTAIAGCAQALHHARSGPVQLGARHLGIAPSYVMACADGAIKILRLGLTGFPSPSQTRGELAYLAPEFARGDGCDARSDVFSLGVMLYELITGRHPYLGPAAPGLSTDRGRLLHTRIEPPTRYVPHLASELAAVVMTAMAQAPADRYPDCHELGRNLLAVAERVAIRTGPAAVRQLVSRLLATGPEPTRSSDESEITKVRIVADTAPRTGVHIAVSRPESASTTPSASRHQSTRPAPAPQREPAFEDSKPPAATTSSASTSADAPPAATPPPAALLHGPKGAPPPPVAPSLNPTFQTRSANKPSAPAADVAAPRRAQPPAAALEVRAAARAPHRMFQAIVLACGATVAVAGVALAVAASTQPMTTTEPAATPSVAREVAPRQGDALDESSAESSAPTQPAPSTSGQLAEPPSAPPAYEPQAAANTMVYEYPTPDPPVYLPPDPAEYPPPAYEPQAEDPTSPPQDQPLPPEPSQPLASAQEDPYAYQPPQEPPTSSPQEP